MGFPNQPNPPSLPSPFKVSNNFIKDEVASGTDPELTPLMMQLGQFLDHDLTLSAEETGGSACLAITYVSLLYICFLYLCSTSLDMHVSHLIYLTECLG